MNLILICNIILITMNSQYYEYYDCNKIMNIGTFLIYFTIHTYYFILFHNQKCRGKFLRFEME